MPAVLRSMPPASLPVVTHSGAESLADHHPLRPGAISAPRAARVPAAMVRAASLLALAGLLLASIGCSGPGPKGAIGSRAADFSLTALDGSPIRLKDFVGRVVILDFWATWCRPCQLEIPHFIDLQAEYGERGLAVIGVAVSDREDNVRRFVDHMRINYTTAMGHDGVVQDYGGFNAIPTTFVIAPDGKIAARYTGYQEKQVFADTIEKLLPSARKTG